MLHADISNFIQLMMVKVAMKIRHILIQWMITKISGASQVKIIKVNNYVLHGNGIFTVITQTVVAIMITIA